MEEKALLAEIERMLRRQTVASLRFVYHLLLRLE